MLRILAALSIPFAIGSVPQHETQPNFGHAAAAISSSAAWDRLAAGNRRYVRGQLEHPHQSPKRRTEVALKQKPFAIVLTCSDSRVPPEVVFDQGIGDLFVVRVAGNIVDDSGLASIEYAVEHLGARFILVMGHSACGAVEAAMASDSDEGHLASVLGPIRASWHNLADHGGMTLAQAIQRNVRQSAYEVKMSEPLFSHWVQPGKVKIVGAYCNLATGKVTLVQ